MTHKAVFLDVDGTLITEEGAVPDSARHAIRVARDRGHLVFLCTGRSPAELWPELTGVGFDGLVAAAGAYVRVHDDVLKCDTLPGSVIDHARDYFSARGVTYYFQGVDEVFGSPGTADLLRGLIAGSFPDPGLRAQLEHGPFRFVDAIVEGDPTPGALLTKVIYVRAQLSRDEIAAEFSGILDVIPSSVPMFGPTSGEMMLPGVHKASGIDALIARLGIDRADTIALGDSYNDIEMLDQVGVGIVMGNAPEPVREVADEVTGTPEADGLFEAFERHHLLDS